MMATNRLRIVPKGDDPMTPLVRLSMARGWHLKAVVARDPGCRTSGELTYLVPDSATVVSLHDDVVTGVKFITVDGVDAEAVARTLREHLDAYAADELLAWWDRADELDDVDDKVDALLFLGVGAPSTPDPAYGERIEAGLRDPDSDVRNAAIVAAAYAAWPVFRAALARVRAGDPDATARARAAIVLEHLAGAADAE